MSNMTIAKVVNGTVVAIGDYRQLFPNVSFTKRGPGDEFMAEHGCYPVTMWKPYDKLTQQLVGGNPYVENGTVYTVHVSNLTAEEIQSKKDEALAAIRATRKQLLADCDWTQANDSPLSLIDKDTWQTYRQTLRDLPSNIEDPRTFTGFPDAPN